MASLTPRDNWIKFLKNEKPERIPSNMDWLTFMPAELIENIARGNVVQQKPFPREQYGGKDPFGGDWIFEDLAGGSIEAAPILDDPDELEDWEEKIHFPNLDEIDWEGCARENRDYLDTDKIVKSTMFTGFFERLISFIGFEEAAMAIVDEDMQETVHALFNRLADLYIDMAARMHRYFNVEYIEFHDDWGTQRSPMMSAQVHREMIIPYIKKTVDGCHKNGVFVEQHSCGFIEPLIPALIDSGIDTWRGQTLNDKYGLVNQYGDRFKFGVEIRPDKPVSDEEMLTLLRKTLEDYKGKRIWLGIGNPLTMGQRELCFKEFLKLQNCA